MQNGFIKVAGVTPDVKVADCRYNADNIIAAMDEMARKRDVYKRQSRYRGFESHPLRHAGAKSALLRLIFFKNKPSARSLAPPFRKKSRAAHLFGTQNCLLPLG